jgi:benzil reductase ((S)-benzoin forming)
MNTSKPTIAVLVSGISRGLGHALFDLLIDQGYRLSGIGRSFTQAQRDAEAAGRCTLIAADFANPAQFAAVNLSHLIDGGITEIVFISNAGIVQPIGKARHIEPQDLIAATMVNYLAPALLVTQLAEMVRPTRAKLRIYNISSGAATKPIPGWASYCSSKAAAQMFLTTLALDEPAMTVHHLDPGVIDTGMQEAIRACLPERMAWVDAFVDMKTAGTLQQPETVARRLLVEAGLL